MEIIVAIHVTKLLTKNFSLSAYGVKYFLGQHMWPFKLYQFFLLNKAINLQQQSQENLVFELG